MKDDQMTNFIKNRFLAQQMAKPIEASQRGQLNGTKAEEEENALGKIILWLCAFQVRKQKMYVYIYMLAPILITFGITLRGMSFK